MCGLLGHRRRCRRSRRSLLHHKASFGNHHRRPPYPPMLSPAVVKVVGLLKPREQRSSAEDSWDSVCCRWQRNVEVTTYKSMSAVAQQRYREVWSHFFLVKLSWQE